MGDLKNVVVLLGVFIVSMGLQIFASRQKSTVLGLILPITLLLATVCILCNDIRLMRNGLVENTSYLNCISYFAVYNVPTILFLCVYNYFQRIRLR